MREIFREERAFVWFFFREERILFVRYRGCWRVSGGGRRLEIFFERRFQEQGR